MKEKTSKSLSEFTNIYGLQKTLRFELVPVEECKMAKDLVCSDNPNLGNSKKLDDNYSKAKEILDKNYRESINTILENLELDNNQINNAYKCHFEENSDIDKILTDLRKSIAEALKELKKVDYKKVLKNSQITDVYDSYIGYFDGYKENRKNLFSGKKQVTSISNRLINENMLLFFENRKIIEAISGKYPELYKIIKENIELEAFEINNYTKCLTQAKIQEYNKLIGRESEENNKKGINQLINEYKQNSGSTDIKYLKKLKNMLLFRDCDSKSVREVDNDEKLINLLRSIIQDYDGYESLLTQYVERTEKLISELNDNVYILPNKINNVSEIVYSKYDELRIKLSENSIGCNEPIFLSTINQLDDKFVEKLKDYYKKCIDGIYFNKKNLEELLKDLSKFDEDKSVPDDSKNKNGGKGFQQIENVQSFFNSIIHLNRFVKVFSSEMEGKQVKKVNRNEDFYQKYDSANEIMDEFQKTYYVVKDYLTKKPYSNDKIRIYFDSNSQFLNGFVESKTENSDNGTQYGGYIFRKKNLEGEYDYFLGCSKSAKLFREDNQSKISEEDKSEYERFYYYQPKNKTIYNSYRNENGETYTFDKDKLRKKIHEVVCQKDPQIHPEEKDGVVESPTAFLKRIREINIDYYNYVIDDCEVVEIQKNIVKNLIKTFRPYQNKISGLKEVLDQQEGSCSLMSFIESVEFVDSYKSFYFAPVNKNEMNKVLRVGNIESDNEKIPSFYLFKIENKDLKDKSKRKNKKGTENIHTMYFKALMSENQQVFDIGKGMVFFRKMNYSGKKVVHSKNIPIKNKTIGYTKSESVFSYDIIKDRRYFANKLYLNLSVSINYSAASTVKTEDFNQKVNKFLYKNKESINIIGIDRGERNLAYITVINQKGEILCQKSLNTIFYDIERIDKKETCNKDYHKILKGREKQRDIARKNWGYIDSIKELKEGYLSQIVHELTLLMKRYNAVIVMEDLNGLKKVRKNIDIQVYQKFEKALVEKLNYFVLKRDEIVDGVEIKKGDVFHGEQLTTPISSFEDIKNQNGFLFYVPPMYTSKIDPLTGFVSVFDLSFKSITGYVQFLEKFESISFNGQDFEFSIDDYSKFYKGDKIKMPLNKFVVSSTGIRYVQQKKDGHWISVQRKPTEDLKNLFEEYGINYSCNLKAELISKKSLSLYTEFMKIFRSIVQLRNSETGNEEIDFIQSPIVSVNGMRINPYNSNEYKVCVNEKYIELPRDADANGAYHIALKGLMAFNTLTKEGKIKILNKLNDWFKFVQTKEYAK